MKVGWCVDDPGYIGGAELTQAEFRAAVPEGVEVIDCPKGNVPTDLDRYVLHNVTRYSYEDFQGIPDEAIYKYLHDIWPHGDEHLRDRVIRACRLIFCSPLQQERMGGHEGEVVPPALDPEAFRPPRGHRRNFERKGAVSVGAFRNPGKGIRQLAEWAALNEPIDVYGIDGDVGEAPIHLKGELRPHEVPQALWDYKTFVFLPTALEPFGRSVVEAYFAGCEIVTNGLVGARHFLETDPKALEDSAERFWQVVLG